MADLGFPGEGAPTSQGGRQHTILPNFPKNCMKLKEFGPPGGGARPKFYYVDPPLLTEMKDQTKQTGLSKQRYQRLFLIGWLSSMVPCDWIIIAHAL